MRTVSTERAGWPAKPFARGGDTDGEEEDRGHHQGHGGLRGDWLVEGLGQGHEQHAEVPATHADSDRDRDHGAHPGGEDARRRSWDDEVADDEEGSHRRRGRDDRGRDGGVEGQVEREETQTRSTGTGAVEGVSDLLLPGRHDEQERDGAHDERLSQALIGDFQETAKHEGLKLSGHVALGQGQDEPDGEEAGEDDGGSGLGGLVMTRAVRDERQDQGRGNGDDGGGRDDRIDPPVDGAGDDPGEDGVDQGLRTELGAAQVDDDADDAGDDAQKHHHDQGPEEKGGIGQGREAGDIEGCQAQLLEDLAEERTVHCDSPSPAPDRRPSNRVVPWPP